ncbi:MAG: YbjN domain-containing protein [Leptospiraceae bacterium]|nr:YbjN domain-containing protein [Leptospiraceae bacterium]
MAFKSREKVRQFAQTRGVELNEYGNEGFWTSEGSTIVYIEFSDFNKSDEMISVYSVVVRNVRVDSTLMSKLLKLNTEFNFGGFGLIDDIIIYRYSLLGGNHVDIDEFFNALAMVALVADEYDNKIISTHGGVTGVDFLTEAIRQKEGTTIAQW